MISSNKIDSEKKRIIAECKACSGVGCGACFGYCAFIDKMVESEIPVDYWFRKIEDFYGDVNFKDELLNYVQNISLQYSKGLAYCFVGPRGTGKTMGACSVLRAALLKNYSALYITMVDSVGKLLSQNAQAFREQIKQIDFMVLDEVDQRFFPSQGSQALYGHQFETIIRTRTQNKLPTIMCTNSEDINQIFDGEFQKSFESLGSQFVKIVRAGGKDARKGKEKL